MSSQAPSPTDDLVTVSRNVSFAYAGIIAGNALRYLTQVAVARQLGSETYGRFVLVVTVITVAATLAELGLPQALVRFVAIFAGESDRGRVKGTIVLGLALGLGASLALGGLVAATAPLLSHLLARDDSLTVALRFFAATLPATTLTTVLVFAFQGLRSVKHKVLVRDVAEPALRLLAVVACAIGGGGLLCVAGAHVAASLLALTLALVVLGAVFPPAYRRGELPVYETGRILAFTWPLLPVVILYNLFLVTDTVVLGILGTAEDVGVYGAAQRTALVCGFTLVSFIAILGPIQADYHNRGMRAELRAIYRTGSRWSLTLTLPFALAFTLLGPSILRLFGPPFARGAAALAILSAGWTAHALLGPAGTLLTAAGRVRIHVVNFAALSIASVTLNVVLVPRFGLVGAALATASSMLVFDVAVVVEAAVLLGIHPFSRALLKPAAAACAAAVALLALGGTAQAVSALAVVGRLALLLAVFFGTLLALGMSAEERVLLHRLRRRPADPERA